MPPLFRSAPTTQMTTPENFVQLFENVKARFDQRPQHGLVCRSGFHKNGSVLKLQKASWTNDSMDGMQNTSGIFFSVWINEASIRKNRANYNIHALKLRHLNGYAITSRDFANNFRTAFATSAGKWPNVGVDYGPLTLMEGWIAINPDSLENDILALMNQFGRLSPLIDRLLDSRRINN
jgi:hypothetical protein